MDGITYFSVQDKRFLSLFFYFSSQLVNRLIQNAIDICCSNYLEAKISNTIIFIVLSLRLCQFYNHYTKNKLIIENSKPRNCSGTVLNYQRSASHPYCK